MRIQPCGSALRFCFQFTNVKRNWKTIFNIMAIARKCSELFKNGFSR